MKLIYAQGFSKTEKLEWKPVVLMNVIQSLRLIFDAMEDYAIEFERDENEVSPALASLSPRPCYHSTPSSVSLILSSGRMVCQCR